MKKAIKVLIFTVALAIYLNIGYGLGTYVYNTCDKLVKDGYGQEYVEKNFSRLSLAGKFLTRPLIESGHMEFHFKYADPIANTRFAWSIFWPLLLLLDALIWFLYVLAISLPSSVVFLFKMIFLGGLFKLVFGIP